MRKLGVVVMLDGKIRPYVESNSVKFRLTIIEREDDDFCQGILIIGDKGIYFSDRGLKTSQSGWGCADILYGVQCYIDAQTPGKKGAATKDLKYYVWEVLHQFVHDLGYMDLTLDMKSLSATHDTVYDEEKDLLHKEAVTLFNF